MTSKGYEVHIITGNEWDLAKIKVERFNISYTHHFSIVDYHRSLGTPMRKLETGWWMDYDVWDKSKGDYCAREGIAIHFDNDLKYANWFPDNCTFVLVKKQGFEKFVSFWESLL
ncbi:MAG: hypothetical protein ACD_79C00870G0001 [uncultured bacterium]|nr:MAG: hypothetical protein ACD_79C00870G0001 [uncultured bacterium]